jgi:hypothetical protein
MPKASHIFSPPPPARVNAAPSGWPAGTFSPLALANMMNPMAKQMTNTTIHRLLRLFDLFRVNKSFSSSGPPIPLLREAKGAHHETLVGFREFHIDGKMISLDLSRAGQHPH